MTNFRPRRGAPEHLIAFYSVTGYRKRNRGVTDNADDGYDSESTMLLNNYSHGVSTNMSTSHEAMSISLTRDTRPSVAAPCACRQLVQHMTGTGIRKRGLFISHHADSRQL